MAKQDTPKRKKIKFNFWLILAVLVLLCGSGFFFVATTAGLKSLIALTERLVPGELKIVMVQGTLYKAVTLEDITYKKSGVDISIKKIALAWQPYDLLKKKVTITALQIQDVDVATATTAKLAPTAPADHESFGLNFDVKKYLHLPFALQISSGHITNIKWHALNDKKQQIVLDSFLVKINLTTEAVQDLTLKIIAKDAFFILEGKEQTQWIWQLQVPQLTKLVPAYRGSLAAAGEMNFAKAKKITIKANGRGDDLKIDQLTLKHFTSEINTIDSSQPTMVGTMNFRQLKLGAISVPQLNIMGTYASKDKAYETRFPALLDIKINKTNVNFIKDKRITNLVLRQAQLQLTNDLSGLNLQIKILLANLPPLNFTLVLPHYGFPQPLTQNQAILAQLNWQINNLNFLRAFLPQLKQLSGKLLIAAKLTGTLAEPKFAGEIKFAQGQTIIPFLKPDPYNINFTLKSINNNTSAYQMQLRSGQGNLSINGQVKCSDANVSATGQIEGKNFLALNNREYKLIISPKLQFKLTNNILHVDGNLLIPQAELRPNLFGGNVKLPQETIFAHEQEPLGGKNPIALYSTIKLVLGKDVTVDAMDIKGHLRGEILITDKPQTATTGVGKIYLANSTYNLYKQPLNITSGNIYFNGGDISNPQISLRAVREIKNAMLPGQDDRLAKLVVGLSVKGYAENYQVTLFSEPGGLATQDILSYIMLGQPSSQASGNNVQLLFKAANALNFTGPTNQVGKILEDLQHTFGLSELSFGGGGAAATPGKNGAMSGITSATGGGLTLGKYLSPRLYIGYSVDLIEALNIFSIRYNLSKHWLLQSESSSRSSGADILYRIEKN